MLPFHIDEGCLGLAASEVRAVVLKSRSLIYFCPECREAFKKIPNIIKEVKNLKTGMNNLKKQVAETTENIKLIQEKIDILEATPHQLATANISEEIENMITEMEERKLRSKNVIILNINESIKANRIERSLDEKQTVLKLLENINIVDRNVVVQRLGKYQQNRCRPIKVVFDNANDAKEVLEVGRT
ncbi:unnamed protein product [Ceutorhynchus assimilis]|uniref:Uncharacterized protein n=1 Tax=Ceutorhynchus assimilis TaxID=467358 RepID=A0A9N9MN27_9CUCU|nr:unnamed protein product [Ceutorhynchus assimilis]